MLLDQILDLIGSVRKSGQGWMAKCPAHEDRSPSLSIREAEDRVLLHCFSGCSVAAICGALGIGIRDLFAENLSPVQWTQLQQARRERKQADHKKKIQESRVIDARREAEALLRASQGQDISQWSEEKFDRVMKAVGRAYDLLREENEDTFYGHLG